MSRRDRRSNQLLWVLIAQIDVAHRKPARSPSKYDSNNAGWQRLLRGRREILGRDRKIVIIVGQQNTLNFVFRFLGQF